MQFETLPGLKILNLLRKITKGALFSAGLITALQLPVQALDETVLVNTQAINSAQPNQVQSCESQSTRLDNNYKYPSLEELLQEKTQGYTIPLTQINQGEYLNCLSEIFGSGLTEEYLNTLENLGILQTGKVENYIGITTKDDFYLKAVQNTIDLNIDIDGLEQTIAFLTKIDSNMYSKEISEARQMIEMLKGLNAKLEKNRLIIENQSPIALPYAEKLDKSLYLLSDIIFGDNEESNDLLFEMLKVNFFPEQSDEEVLTEFVASTKQEAGKLYKRDILKDLLLNLAVKDAEGNPLSDQILSMEDGSTKTIDGIEYTKEQLINYLALQLSLQISAEIKSVANEFSNLSTDISNPDRATHYKLAQYLSDLPFHNNLRGFATAYIKWRYNPLREYHGAIGAIQDEQRSLIDSSIVCTSNYLTRYYKKLAIKQGLKFEENGSFEKKSESI